MVDGEHIKILLLTFFFKHMEDLITKGKVYIAQSPLYKVTKGKESKYLLNDEELEKYKKQHGDNITIQRFKGLKTN